VEPAAPSEVDALVEHLFRHSAGRMVSSLARRLGSARLDLAEEAVQDALVRALHTWPYGGVPAEPRGWLFQVAKHRALDLLRREASLRGKLEIIEGEPGSVLSLDVAEDAAVGDDELAMMFMCCHLLLPSLARIALTLKTVGGFSVEEIAAAFLAEPATIAQRLVRAKRQIREQDIPIEIPRSDEIDERLESVLEVLYLFFNEGYSVHGGENLVREELCGEAIRLAGILAGNRRTDLPPVHALLALMLLQASRLPARVDDAGDLLLLSEQDRARWDQGLIAEGLRHLDRASAGESMTAYHVEAAIAACHAVAPDEASTNWTYVLRLYGELLALKPSPVVELNRAIALAMVEGPTAGIRAIESIREHPALARYYLLPAALGALWLRAGDTTRAADYYREALARPSSSPERRFLEKQLERCTAV
jgi:RNA polymerase sigma-70 factor (ECF subfamily)